MNVSNKRKRAPQNAILADELDNKLIEAWKRHNGKLILIANEVGLKRSNTWAKLKRLGLTKPLVGGSVEGTQPQIAKLPGEGRIKRYICTSAQNNTRVNSVVWKNLLALKKHYKATLLVGTFTYNQNAYGQMSVKRGTAKHDHKLWYDDCLISYFADYRMVLAEGLVWCGESNILPTAELPLDGFETYSGRKSAIFPQAKIAMRSIAGMKYEGTKFNYTTGTVTQMNYIQKKAGLKGEQHHAYGGVIVEIDHNGNWWVRQIEADSEGTIYDLGHMGSTGAGVIRARNGRISVGHRVEAITWGDIHATAIDPIVHRLSVDEGGMLDELNPRTQFIHDLWEGASVNHHAMDDPHERYRTFVRGLTNVETEARASTEVLQTYRRPHTETVVVDSNHDNWVVRWLKEHDYREDPLNALLFLELQIAYYKAIHEVNKSFNLIEFITNRYIDSALNLKFLRTDESFRICDGKIECGMHGHLGSDGARGTPTNLCKIARPSNTAHTHSAGIYNQLFVAGTSSLLDMGFNKGPSSWSHSHIVTYPSGKRTIVTMYAGKWRA